MALLSTNAPVVPVVPVPAPAPASPLEPVAVDEPPGLMDRSVATTLADVVKKLAGPAAALARKVPELWQRSAGWVSRTASKQPVVAVLAVLLALCVLTKAVGVLAQLAAVVVVGYAVLTTLVSSREPARAP